MLHLIERTRKYLFRKQEDIITQEISSAIQDIGSVPDIPLNDRRRGLSDILGNTSKAAGYFSDAVPKHVHLKFVRKKNFIIMMTQFSVLIWGLFFYL